MAVEIVGSPFFLKDILLSMLALVCVCVCNTADTSIKNSFWGVPWWSSG